MNLRDIERKLRKLPDRLVRQILDYIDFLVSRYVSEDFAQKLGGKGVTFSWADGLSDLKEQFTPVELQHRASQLRGKRG